MSAGEPPILDLVARAIALNRGDSPEKADDWECALDDARQALRVLLPLERGRDYVVQIAPGAIKPEDVAALAEAFRDAEERAGVRFTVVREGVSVQRQPDPERMAETKDELRPQIVRELAGTMMADPDALVELADAVLSPVGEALEDLRIRLHGVREGVRVALTALDLGLDLNEFSPMTNPERVRDKAAEAREILTAVLAGKWDDEDSGFPFDDEGPGEEDPSAVDAVLGPETEEA